MGSVVRAVVFALAPVAGMVVGGAAAAWWRPDGRVRAAIQHLAGGVVFAAVGVEILPGVMHRQDPLAAGAGFALGVAAMLALRALSRRAEERDRGGRLPWALLGAVLVDVFVDGLLIGVGFAAGERQGALLALALTGCALSLGMATATALLGAGTRRPRAAGITAGLGLVPALGAAAGALLAGRLGPGGMEVVLAFTCAALLYLVTEELLVEAHEHLPGRETPLMTAVFFVGFTGLLLADMAA